MGEEKCTECGEVKKIYGRGMCKQCYQRLWSRKKRARVKQNSGKQCPAEVSGNIPGRVEDEWQKVVKAVDGFLAAATDGIKALQEANRKLREANRRLEEANKELRRGLIQACAEKRRLQGEVQRLSGFVPEMLQEG